MRPLRMRPMGARPCGSIRPRWCTVKPRRGVMATTQFSDAMYSSRMTRGDSCAHDPAQLSSSSESSKGAWLRMSSSAMFATASTRTLAPTMPSASAPRTTRHAMMSPSSSPR